MPFNIGPVELLLVLVLVLVILGPGKLPQVGSSLARAVREIRKATDEDAPVDADAASETRPVNGA